LQGLYAAGDLGCLFRRYRIPIITFIETLEQRASSARALVRWPFQQLRERFVGHGFSLLRAAA
jgi:hypothetical protein